MEDEEAQQEVDFNPTACAELYNHLIRIGFHGSNRAQKGDYIRTNWFEVWKTDPQVSQCRERFQQPFIEFLEQIELVVESDGSAPARDVLIYHLQSILPPEAINYPDFDVEWLREYIDCCYLFPNNLDGMDGLGVVIELENLMVQYIPNMEDYDIEENEDISWYSLLEFLEMLVQSVEVGQYIPVPYNQKLQCRTAPYISGWKCVPWTDYTLETTLEAWEQLIDTIETRLPNPPSQRISRPQTLATENDIPSYTDGFSRAFLLRASKPSFEFIAPGLSVYSSDAPPPPIPTKDDGNEFLMYDVQGVFTYVYHDPIVLFPFKEEVREDFSGLWILPEQDWADTFELVLPCKADIHLTSNPRSTSRTSLFQAELCPFYGRHRSRLVDVFSFWECLITEGVWTVGAEGVEGGKGFYEQVEESDKRDFFYPETCCHGIPDE